MTLRQELYSYIDEIPEKKLIALKPLLFALADESITIDTNLSEEEYTLIAVGMAQYETNPKSFVSLDDIG